MDVVLQLAFGAVVLPLDFHCSVGPHGELTPLHEALRGVPLDRVQHYLTRACGGPLDEAHVGLAVPLLLTLGAALQDEQVARELVFARPPGDGGLPLEDLSLRAFPPPEPRPHERAAMGI